MPVKINPLLKQFYLFLEERNALMAWENNLLNHDPDRTRAMFFAKFQLDGYQFIISAFTWNRSPEGSMYWQDLHRKWCDEAGV